MRANLHLVPAAAIRTLRPDERQAVLALLDEWPLPDGWRGRDFFARYLERDPTYADESFLVAERAGRLVACVQIFPRRLRVRGVPVPAGGIGSVFTTQAARGRGLASALLERAIAAMRARGMELSLLFTGRQGFYDRLGWAVWPRQGSVWVREGAAAAPEDSARAEIFDAARDLGAAMAVQAAYAAPRDGTVVRDRAFFTAQLGFAGNPDEDFVVARDARGQVRAYARGCVLEGLYCVSELARRDDARSAAALADLLLHLLAPRDPDPLAARVGRTSAELRRALVAPPHEDAALATALAARGVAARPFEDRGAMLRPLDADALARRTGIARGPGEAPLDHLRRVLPPGRFCFWPADRF